MALQGLAGASLAAPAQQTQRPINFEALLNITDPQLQQIAAQMLIQRLMTSQQPLSPTQQFTQDQLDALAKLPEAERQKILVERARQGGGVTVNLGEQRAVTNTLSLRKDFQADPRIKDMRIIEKFTSNVETAYKRSLTAKNLGPVDISLAKSFQKLTDLGSSVREGEFATTFEGQKLINRVKGKIEQFLKGGLGFTQEDRKEIRDLVRLLQKDSQKLFNNAMDEFGVTADEFNFNKRAIFGGIKKFDIEGTTPPSGQQAFTPQQIEAELRRRGVQ